MPPPEVLGPLGLTIAACVVAVVLWRAHEASDADVKAQRDAAIARSDKLIDVSRDQVAATNRLADLIESRQSK